MAPIKSQKPKSGSSNSSAKSAKSSKHSKAKTHTPVGTAKTDANKKKKRTYTEEELGIPKLNMITPAGVQKPKGKKKGKVFVDDQIAARTIQTVVDGGRSPEDSAQPLILVFVFSGFSPGFREFILCCFRMLMESMMTILAMVNAEQEGQIESKMMRARQMEEIREARKKEAEVRQEKKRSKLVSTSSNWEAYCESIAAAIEETKESLKKKRKSRPESVPEKKEESTSTKPAKPSRKRVSFG
ncbi:60S ribosomal subunit assembly/export protein LOC1 [Botryosphaeria dothidea]|uniref:60S ribosomal subunit assembly/export protein LOC1 n=1 Tax=Botryosphaeria dothidea TaxID=55169 RepID=A0A8H4IMH6_9PEZI|nr:60S ribosomal subunit assembly/export protein LOC1 [Botryosphaeria dothidea]